ncbi:hypothetical protein OG500_35095 [Kitasatospora sp. NBC_01250]|uniref:protease pro-enzyme activation domain-containing protein n=1 Tax=Kitasatospora sp. NBC_01250 TaxID=2903571 RepID=UPI002E31808C|nr:protease pro-enzyme activation domain-containing protein [Kitasatospora sp. NBC_01250]
MTRRASPGGPVRRANAHDLAVTATVDQARTAFATSVHGYAWGAGQDPVFLRPVTGVSMPTALGHDISTVLGLDSDNPYVPDAAGTVAPRTTVPQAAAPRPAAPRPAAPRPAASRTAMPQAAVPQSAATAPATTTSSASAR